MKMCKTFRLRGYQPRFRGVLSLFDRAELLRLWLDVDGLYHVPSFGGHLNTKVLYPFSIRHFLKFLAWSTTGRRLRESGSKWMDFSWQMTSSTVELLKLRIRLWKFLQQMLAKTCQSLASLPNRGFWPLIKLIKPPVRLVLRAPASMKILYRHFTWAKIQDT